jgi:aminoglycoside phosphotransferase family enzyme
MKVERALRSAKPAHAAKLSPAARLERDTQEKLDFLTDARHFPGRPARIELVETHFAWVFMTGRHAYKMKKPLRRAAMDYRTVAQRERGCRNEVRLNRRLAPAVYIGVVPLGRTRRGELALGGGPTVVDWLIKMHRLPAARMLDRAIARHTVTAADLTALSAVLAAFFRRARRMPMAAARYQKLLRARTLRNARDLRAPDLGLNRATIDAVCRTQLAFVSDAAPLLGRRGVKLVEGHGDLRPEHVCLASRPRVIDCLEFDPRLRRLDPAEEIAFLALECARLGASWVSDELLRGYRAAMRDRVPDALIHFYVSQRAATRAKIAAWHVRDPAYERRRWIARANDYLSDALHHARAARHLIAPQSSLPRLGWPAAQERRERLARQHALHGLAQQRRDGQQDELVAQGCRG